MKIRAAVVADANELAHVSADTYRTTYGGMFSSDSWLDFATPEYFLPIWQADLDPATSEGPLVAESCGRILGFIAAKWNGDSGDAYRDVPPATFVELKELYVPSCHQFSEEGRHESPVRAD